MPYDTCGGTCIVDMLQHIQRHAVSVVTNVLELQFRSKRCNILQCIAEDGHIEIIPADYVHSQPIYFECEYFGGSVSDRLFEKGLCIPSGSSLSYDDQSRVIATLKKLAR